MRILITGITGTLGTALADLHHARGDAVLGCARSEARAVEWLRERGKLATLLLGDAAMLADPRTDLGRLLPTVDRVYHCAAMKHVEICEENPIEAFRQNVSLTDAVASACRRWGVEFVLASSDKACLPRGTYGCTKLLSERIAIREGGAVGRLGNLVGSSSSVFAVWAEAVKNHRPIRLTDPDMTRYFMSVSRAAEFLADDAEFGKISMPHPLKSARMGDVAAAITGCRDVVQAIQRNKAVGIGSRPGETQHQWLVAPGEPYEEKCSDGPMTDINESRSGGLPPLPNVIVLSGERSGPGMCSATAERWDPRELLKLAGIK